MPVTLPTLTIDTREPDKLVKKLEEVCARERIPTVHSALTIGDFRWGEGEGRRVVVERKTVNDLVGSLRDGRWSRQINELATADLPIILLCGSFGSRLGKVISDGQQFNWQFASVDGALFVAQLLGVKIAHSGGGLEDTAHRLLGLYRASLETHHRSLVRKPPSFLASESERMAVNVLLALPGMGPATAKRLLGRFGTPLAALYGVAYPTGDLAVPDSTLKRWQAILTNGADLDGRRTA